MKLGLSDKQFLDATNGIAPQGVSDEEAVAYDTALKLARDRRALDDNSFSRAEKVLGKEGVAGLANVVAGYLYVCILVSVAGPNPGGWVPEVDGKVAMTDEPPYAGRAI